MANKYLRKVIVAAAATETDLYTVPAANAGVISSLRVTNANGSRGAVTVSQYSALDAAEHFLLKSYSIAPSTTIDVFNGVPCVLMEGDKITVESSVATTHFYLSYLEVDRN